ncbi:MAG: YesL family protein [Oscillospiraceae bacterium]|nr:YesL family protein [Oscillospiraceae bacterium]
MNFLFGRGQKFYQFATKLAELMWLNFLVFLCSIPVLTIGAATSAMHHVLIQIYRDEEQKITRTFFSAFKKNFGQATLVWLIYLAFYFFLLLDNWALRALDNPSLKYLNIFVPAMVFISAMGLSWSFVLQGRYALSIKEIFSFSFTRIIAFPIRSLFMALCIILPVVFALYLPQYLIIVVLMGITVPGILQTCFYNKALLIMEDDSDENTPEETNQENDEN